jgi:1A family penicillin-binding protein
MAKRKLYRQVYQKDKKGTKLFFALRALFLGFLLLAFFVFTVFLFFAKDLPRPEKFTERQFVQSTKIYDRTGQVVLYDIYGEERREIVSLEEIPEYLKEAVITAEDSDFYNHFGIDIKGIFRSILINLKIAKPVYGGSTIPQQLIRSTFFSLEKTAERKIREIVLALELDRRYSKEQILGWYLNQVPFGQNAYGVEEASQTYFGKSVSKVSLAEATVLASLIQAPSRLSPFGENKADLLARKDYVLDRMVEEGYINQEEAEAAKKETLDFPEKPIKIKAPYFTLWVKQYLEEKYGPELLERGGLKVYTSLDWEIQEIAEEVVKERVQQNRIYNAYNAGLTAIDPNSGEILAMTVGTGDYFAPPYPEGCTPGKDCLFDPQFNVVVGTAANPGRQPGSSFKPFVYATAFKNGYTADTTLIDEQTNFGIWGGKEYIPQNYDGLFRGETTLRGALAQSINVPSVKVLVGLCGPTPQESIENSVKTAQDMGITTLSPPYGPSIVLGGWEVKLLDMVSAYGVFATEGLRTPPVAILRIEDAQGNIIEENKKSSKRVLPVQVARTINDILSDNEARAPMFGRNSNLYFKDYQVAAKTGTTQDYRDAWTLGYTPSIAVGVWVGNSNNAPMSKQPGVVLAGPIFHNFLEKVLPMYPKEEFSSL